MKDKIIQISIARGESTFPDVYGLSESGNIYRYIFNHEKGEWDWELRCESPIITSEATEK